MSANNQDLRRAWAVSVSRTATVLAQHDPASIADENPDPPGEYRAEAETLVRYLCMSPTAQEAVAIVRRVLDEAFGPGFEIAEDALDRLTRDLLRATQLPSET
jgi:hypothetical protein